MLSIRTPKVNCLNKSVLEDWVQQMMDGLKPKVARFKYKILNFIKDQIILTISFFTPSLRQNCAVCS